MSEHRVEIPDPVLRAIGVIARAESMPRQERYVAIMVITFGAMWYASGTEMIDGRQWELPERQWLDICQACLDIGVDRIEQVNYALSFMNAGPSSYKKEESNAPEQPDA